MLAAHQIEWRKAAQDVLHRAGQTATQLPKGFPHWANGTTGQWTTTPDGDWTGGALPGMLWLGYRMTGDARFAALAHDWCVKLHPRAKLETAFKGFGFYYGAALGQRLAKDEAADGIALEAAQSLLRQFDARLSLIPLGKDAEEAGEIGKAFSNIDSLQAVPLLFWAAERTGDKAYAEVASAHTTRVLDIHCQPDGSIIQSSELNAADGKLMRHFTHKGFSDHSVWGRAQAWGMVYAAIASAHRPEQARWLRQGIAAADWWLSHVPESRVAYWDFDDPSIPNAESDTAATAIACAALLKFAELAPQQSQRTRYREAAENAATALVSNYLTPTSAADQRPRGMLVGGCFNKRADSRPQDSVTNAELIFGSYYFLESMQILAGVIGPLEI